LKNQSKNLFFISDLHFGHAACIRYCERPFKSVEEMDEKIIKNWNSVVRPQDTTVVAGDFFMYHKKEKLKEILSRLNGYKILVRGNHDMSPAEMQTIGFHHVCEFMTMKIGGEIVNISHYPYKGPKLKRIYYSIMNKLFPKKFWKPRKFDGQMEDDGRFLIHGHTHSKRIVKGRMIHVGVDAHGFKPVPLQKIGNIIAMIKLGKYKEAPVKDNSYHE
jgi:calcineurin-like phosphoesterase family protein